MASRTFRCRPGSQSAANGSRAEQAGDAAPAGRHGGGSPAGPAPALPISALPAAALPAGALPPGALHTEHSTVDGGPSFAAPSFDPSGLPVTGLGPPGTAVIRAHRSEPVEDGEPVSALATARHAAGELLGNLGRLFTPRGVRGALLETAWVSVHLALYPLGVMRERPEQDERYHLRGLRPVQRGLVVGNVEAAGTPILLLHGMVDNRAIFTVLRRRLRQRGFGRVFALNYSPATNDIRAAARDLSAAVEELVAQTGYERIHLIGHSLGGLIARYYVQRLGGDERVHTLVTLGTPHQGSLLAHLVPVNLCRQLSPGSDLYQELAEPAAGTRTRFVAYWSDADQLILPRENARLDHPDLTVHNVLVPTTGHMSIPIHPVVAHEISLLLSQLDSDGTTLTAGVTWLVDGVRVPSARSER